MNLLSKFTQSAQAEMDAPPSPMLKVFRWLFVVVLFSFVFDYRAPDIAFGAAKTGGSKAQYIFLLAALGAGGAITFLGMRHLLIRPGVYLVVMWWGYIFGSLAVSVLWGNELGRILRLAISMLMVGFGLNATLICAAAGMRVSEAVRWFLFAALTNVAWRFFFGATMTNIPLSEVRMSILSPGMRFLFAWTGCALLLRRKFTWWSLLIFGLPLAVAALSITRSMVLPIGVSFIMGGGCLALGIMWKMYDMSFPFKKLMPLVAMGVIMVFLILGVAIAMPNMADRWIERMGDSNKGGGATTMDLSTLMRLAEAKSMMDILKEDGHAFIYGRGLGASYYWDESYFPELFLVYPADRHQFPHEIYTAGHSVWTYTLFSTGWIGIGITLLAFFIPMGMSLHSARLLSKTVMGARSWDTFLAFLPFVAMWAVLSESITRNPFDERYTGVLFGFIMALPQFFYNRAYYLAYREKVGQEVPQMIIDEDTESALGENLEEEIYQARPNEFQAGNHHLVGSRTEYQEGEYERRRSW